MSEDPVRRVVFALFDDFVLLDLAGPADVLRTTARVGGAGYELVLASPDGRPVRADNGVGVAADVALADIAGTPLDTLVVVGGPGVHAFAGDGRSVDALRALSRGARGTASICTGAIALAAAGLLDGRRATTHWAASERLAARHPEVTVDADRIFVRDGDVWTSAGVTAGIDLALALLEADEGPEVGHAVAAGLVVYARRQGGQAQFSTQLRHQARTSTPVAELQRWIAGHLEDPLTVEALAERAGMTPRTFARLFRRETGTTPAAYVEMARIEAAQRLLATTELPVGLVARRVGLGGPEVLHRSFRRRTGTTPGRYRDHFGRLGTSVSS